LVSVIDLSQTALDVDELERTLSYHFYSISLKRNCAGFLYGQRHYDFDDGIMSFVAPRQVIHLEESVPPRPMGLLLVVHPDFFQRYPLAATIKSYGFFSYAIHEGLRLSEAEDHMVVDLMKSIDREVGASTDSFTQDLVVSYIDLLLKHCNRFYHRQFLAQQVANGDLLLKLEEHLNRYFDKDRRSGDGLPTVQFLASQLNLSPNYLSDLLLALTGQSTRQHIQNKILERAKIMLSMTDLSVSEIAYSLGFDYPQSFHRLFRSKTHQSPREFRERATTENTDAHGN
jgi:AraC-like DNA-binding protein